MTLKVLIGTFLICVFSFNFVVGAHFIVGFVENAADGESANGKTVVLWNTAVGKSDNLTDTVGPSGNSGANNIYLIDCELLQGDCNVGDEIAVEIINNGDEYFSNNATEIVSGAGFDLMDNLTLNSPPDVQNISFDDAIGNPHGEIDLTPANTREAICQGVIREYDGENELTGVRAEVFDLTGSGYGDSDDNNVHYTNETCTFDLGYGDANEASYNCRFNLEYYSNPGNWNCTVEASDNSSSRGYEANVSAVNTLLALEVPDVLDFGLVNATAVSLEQEINVTNMGNARVNLSLVGYGGVLGDGWVMNCSLGNNISAYYAKYNLTDSNPGDLTLGQFEGLYENLTGDTQIKDFDLNFRQSDIVHDGTNDTYWRSYVPPGVGGSCSGNIVFGAVVAEGS